MMMMMMMKMKMKMMMKTMIMMMRIMMMASPWLETSTWWQAGHRETTAPQLIVIYVTEIQK